MGTMHEYSIEGKNLKNKRIIMIIISLVIAYLISLVVSTISDKFSINLWWLEIPSVIGVYEGIEYLIDKFCWSKFYGIDSFEGTWDGYLESSYDNYNQKIPIINCIIKQNSKNICIIYEMEKSTSYSTSARLNLATINGVTLDYDYINIPKIEENGMLNIHIGTNTLKLKGNELEGEYFNKQRKTSGKIYLKKKEEN